MIPPFFNGEFRLQVDEKHRLFLPAQIRAAINPETHGSKFYIQTTYNALLFYPDKYYQFLVNSLFPLDITSDPDLMAYKRKMFGLLSEVSCDKQGRISLPEVALQRANIGSTTALVGTQDHFALFDRAEWEKQVVGFIERPVETETRGKESLKRLQAHSSGNPLQAFIENQSKQKKKEN